MGRVGEHRSSTPSTGLLRRESGGRGGEDSGFGVPLARLGRRDRKSRIARRRIDLADEAVGRIEIIGDSGERKFLGLVILQGAKHPLRAATRLGRIYVKVLDAELGEHPANLGTNAWRAFAAGFERMKMGAAAISIERAK